MHARCQILLNITKYETRWLTDCVLFLFGFTFDPKRHKDNIFDALNSFNIHYNIEIRSEYPKRWTYSESVGGGQASSPTHRSLDIYIYN